MNGNISCILFLPFSFTQDQCKFRCYRSLYGKVIVEETRKPFLFCSIVTFAASTVLSRQRNHSGRKRLAGTTEDTILVFWKRSRVIVRDNRAFWRKFFVQIFCILNKDTCKKKQSLVNLFIFFFSDLFNLLSERNSKKNLFTYELMIFLYHFQFQFIHVGRRWDRINKFTHN